MTPVELTLSPHAEASQASATESPVPARRTRKQVSRACDLCRARRIRCDNGQPCKACRQRRVECTHKGDDEPRTLPAALREIDKLKLQVKELETKLSTLELQQNTPALMPTPSCSSDSQSRPNRRQSLRDGLSQNSPQFSVSSTRRPQWEGIHVATAGSNQPSYYGPASSFYLVSRIGRYLGKMLRQPYVNQSLHPRSANTNTLMRDEVATDGSRESHSLRGPSTGHETDLTRTQEESLLRLFWEGYHCLLPVIDEVEFRKHYASLWGPSRRSRAPSPLVDIILALCLQYGYAFTPKQTTNQVSNRTGAVDDATMAGRSFYLRSQSLLAADLESPTVMTVQCYIFTITYLCCASFLNMCHIMEAQAIRTAQVLGLHLEPPPDLPHGAKELRRRIWWVLWTLEAKTSTKLGRPLIVDWAQVTVTMPGDDLEAASYNGAVLGSYSDVTWLSYALQVQKVHRIMVDIHDALFFKCGEVIDENALACIYHDPDALETCARLLATKLPAIKDWADNVPDSLKTRRRSGGAAFSTDRSALDIECLAPSWLQRQRVCLELTYFNIVINLTRPFITFYSHPGTYTPMTERHATTCVDHAISFTLLMHQVVTETDLLSGWSEYFSIQWNAAITIIAFILAHPIHPATPRAHQALEKALAVFDIFGVHFPVSADAAAITRDLIAKANSLAGHGAGSITPGEEPELSLPSAPAMGVPESTLGNDNLAWLDPNQQDESGQFSQFIDWALSVDSFNNFERFFEASNPTDAWSNGQS
ncbi:fungal-specific transcription factor domain-containing protein [Thelonectria olida]|uniref:Fungal-specific transcription factor domain-containing protein n=1 Tax=Thelonectria olida TaxID=1576542 RepID=A0A9P8W8I5_9HYPO|nr:fungal-specific transcription factor domain-containing protein [Thelonectria olida]